LNIKAAAVGACSGSCPDPRPVCGTTANSNIGSDYYPNNCVSSQQLYQTDSKSSSDPLGSVNALKNSGPVQGLSCTDPIDPPLGYSRATDCLPLQQATDRKTAELTLEQGILKENLGQKLYNLCGTAPYKYGLPDQARHDNWTKCAQALESNTESTQAQVVPKEVVIDINPVTNTQKINTTTSQDKKPIVNKIHTATTTATIAIVQSTSTASTTAIQTTSTATTTVQAVPIATTTIQVNANWGLFHRFFGWLGF